MKLKVFFIIFVVLGFIGLITLRALQFNGFCAKELRFLSEQEIIDNFLLTEPWRVFRGNEFEELKAELESLTPEERQERIEKNRQIFPNCCELKWEINTDFHPRLSSLWYTYEKYIKGNYLRYLFTYIPRGGFPDEATYFQYQETVVPNCPIIGMYGGPTMSISKVEYLQKTSALKERHND